MRWVWDARGELGAALAERLGVGQQGTGVPEEEGLYRLEGGTLGVTWSGGEVELGPGALVARWSLLEGGVSATLRGDEGLSWRKVDKETIEHLLKGAPETYADLMAALAKWSPRIVEGSAAGRLRRLLLAWSRHWGPQVPGPLAASELSRLVGAPRDTVDAVLTRWRESGDLEEEAGFWRLSNRMLSRG